ncbi:mandelate racemase/muconate lactonizing enzyme family protein [Bradyrhizobium diazoefficiens]|uniref:mandelate racemase/muconate lactonizing enzyme family protein n=1 Tax=Bradyrhizobium diazoefficiens TaxID=1355477 RepID=UPI00190E5A5F|nr:mandelate racemase/muconate lactonizing enzyme family protein [Bradyrhizobium diazoefficiens]
MAFWDILGKAADVPVVRLLGGAPPPFRPMIATACQTSAPMSRLSDAISSADSRLIKIKIGAGDLAQDIEAVRWARELIDPDIALMSTTSKPGSCRSRPAYRAPAGIRPQVAPRCHRRPKVSIWASRSELG